VKYNLQYEIYITLFIKVNKKKYGSKVQGSAFKGFNHRHETITFEILTPER
jgi:hypothetical protein